MTDDEKVKDLYDRLIATLNFNKETLERFLQNPKYQEYLAKVQAEEEGSVNKIALSCFKSFREISPYVEKFLTPSYRAEEKTEPTSRPRP